MRVLADGRVKRSEAEWRVLLARFASSGVPETQFCRREKISRSTFIKWKRRLASVEPAAVQEDASFVEWPAPASCVDPALATGEFELSLPGGVRLRWRA